MQSSIDFIISVVESPVSASSIGPHIAIAPTQTTSEAVTNPSTNCPSPFAFTLLLIFSPTLSRRFSILISSPQSPPKRSEKTISIPPPDTMDFPSLESIISNAPPSPIKTTARPHACVIICLNLSFIPLLNIKPSPLPKIMARTLTIVPKPRIQILRIPNFKILIIITHFSKYFNI